MKLTEAQRMFLGECERLGPRSTSPATGGVARALEGRGLVTLSYKLGTTATITDAGREVLAAIRGAGRQAALELPEGRPAVSCPVCHRLRVKVRQPPASATMHSHRDSDGKLCAAAGMTLEGAKVEAMEMDIAWRLRMGHVDTVIAADHGITVARVAVVQTQIDAGRR